MANTWPKQTRLIGKRHRRLDGPEKATGHAKYSFDINRPGMLHAMILRSPHAHAKITKIDTEAANMMPGVRAIYQIIKKIGEEVFVAGDEIVALAADTEEHAHDALRAIKITYEVLPHLVREVDALKSKTGTMGNDPMGKPVPNISVAGEFATDNFDAEAWKGADAIVEGTYGVSTICHQCLESHGLVAEWDNEGGLTVWASTQAVPTTASALAQYFKIPVPKVRCITHHMGGGYGSKFGPDIQGIVAAELAKKSKAPVKLMLDREEEATMGGNRPSAYGTVKIAGTKAGKITAYQVDCYGTPGVGGGATVNLNVLPYVYATIPNIKRKHTVIRLNTGSARAMPRPGHPQNCFLTDSAVDDLAAKLGIDPLELRLKNLPPNDPEAVQKAPQSLNALRHTIYTTEIDIAIKEVDWKKRWHPPGKGPEKGPVKSGLGMALHTWGGAGYPNNDVVITISSDGSVLLQSSTQDLGTGERTLLPIVAGEILGLDVKDITVKIGESQYGRSTGSGGSTTAPGTVPAALNAAVAARDALLQKIAGKLKQKPEDLSIAPGQIVAKDGKKWSWKEACARLGMDPVKGTGNWTPGLSNNGVGGVQIAEVKVDIETGVVQCTKMVAVQDCGLIINLQGCESQVAGGVIMGVNYALFEERIMDRVTGRQVNPNMEFYKLGGIEDMPHIVVKMHDMPERGVIGIGEPPTISTATAIGNAVHNAIGVRVPFAPFTPERVLEALSKKGGKV